MFNLSLTACSFHLRKTNSRGNGEVDKEIMWRGYRYSTPMYIIKCRELLEVSI